MRLRQTIFALPLLGVLLAACNAPISPGYQIEKQELEVRFVSSPDQSLHVRATYRLKNIGNTPLDLIEASLPADSSFSPRNLSIQIDGRSVSPSLSDAEVRIPFTPPLPFKDRRTLTIEYDLASPQQFTKDAVYLLPRDWHPALLTPKHFLSKGSKPPEKWDLRIRVPDGFLVHASGTPRGSSRSGSERVSRFTQRRGIDFPPFIVSGRYHENVVRHQGMTINFWSLHSLPAAKFAPVATRLASTAAVFQDLFGPATKGSLALWIVETAPTPSPRGRGIIVSPFPAGVLLPSPLFEETLEQPVPLEFTEALLADTWLSQLSAPNLGPYGFVELSLVHHAVWVARERRGESLDARSIAMQSPPGSEKARLFALALRDKCGNKSLNRGLHRMIQARRGSHWTVDDLRSALELESGQNLAEFFRVWLYQPGIPDDFRRRYAQP